MPETENPDVILALDVESRKRAELLLDAVGEELNWVKIGLQTYLRDGPDFVRELHSRGKKVFLDLKLHDIPNTMAKAIVSLGELPISMLTIHATAGPVAIERCSKTMREVLPEATLLAVTVLTSMDEETLRALGVPNSPEKQVQNLATLSANAGAKGIVCSPWEIQTLRSSLPTDTTLVSPGIRPTGASLDDQSRVMTPFQAAEAGADFLVIGRPILAAENPSEALANIKSELQEAKDTPEQ